MNQVVNKNKVKHYPALDGLRGLAILLVIFYHNFGFINYSVFGWVGVDLFFVLSGFLITAILLNTVNAENYLKNFYARRILRIFPLYCLSLIIFLFILPYFFPLKAQAQFYLDHQWWYWLYLQNWLLSFHFPITTSYLNHYWSLAVEEQFYLIWPLIILWLRKPKPLLIFMIFLLILLLAARSAVWMQKIEGLNYTTFYTFTRIDGICIGCMLALLHRINFNFLRNNTGVIVILLAILNFGFYFLNQIGEFPYLAFVGYTTFAAMFGLLVHEAVSGETKVINFIFTRRILIFFGIISYGLYIFHWPVYELLYPVFQKTISNSLDISSTLNRAISAILVTVIAIIISVFSYYGFENKFLKLKKYFV